MTYKSWHLIFWTTCFRLLFSYSPVAKIACMFRTYQSICNLYIRDLFFFTSCYCLWISFQILRVLSNLFLLSYCLDCITTLHVHFGFLLDFFPLCFWRVKSFLTDFFVCIGTLCQRLGMGWPALILIYPASFCMCLCYKASWSL